MAVEIKFGPKAVKENVTNFSLKVLEDIMEKAGIGSALITSTARTPADQARAMFDNIKATSVAKQKALYAAMEAKIIAIGPTKVSHHAADPNLLCVFDVAPSSIAKKSEFEKAVRADKRVSKFLVPPLDPAYHLEIPQPK
jgi:hypothetical protein